MENNTPYTDSFEKNSSLKLKVAYSSLIAAIVITIIKIAAAWFSGSLGILSEVINSAIDIFVCVITIVSINYSSRPPDEQHNYGYEKIENFSAIIQVVVLFGTSGYILFEAFRRIAVHQPGNLNISVWTFAALVLTIVIDINRSAKLRKVAKETRSHALEADSIHFTSDIFSSVVVILGLGLYLIGFEWGDIFGAIAVAGIIIFMGVKMFKKAFDSLLDKVPQGIYEKIKYETLLIKGVEGIKNLRIRSSGSKTFIDMVINLNRIIPFAEAHNIMDIVERKLMMTFPNSDIVLHGEPVETEVETINDKIKLIVNSYKLKSHDVISYKIGSEIFAELHVEIKDTNDLTAAHSLITEIENKIKAELKEITRVRVHIDEPSYQVYDTLDITEESPKLLGCIKEIIKTQPEVISEDEILILSTNGKIRVSLSCIFDQMLSFDEVHDLVTLLEARIFSELKSRFPKLSNVIIHAEPGKKF
ncbi:cation diffusion facilitator family transporter [soil metagenome]